jgi:hypothetical protein
VSRGLQGALVREDLGKARDLGRRAARTPRRHGAWAGDVAARRDILAKTISNLTTLSTFISQKLYCSAQSDE